MRHLEALRLPLERGEAVGPEEAGRRIEPVAAVTVEQDVVRVEEYRGLLRMLVRTPFSRRIGLGGYITVSMKSVKACISSSELGRASEQAREGLVELLERRPRRTRRRAAHRCRRTIAAPVHGPWFAMPRRLCVVIGPFSGCVLVRHVDAEGQGLLRTTSSGLPRSHARLSKSPKMWQLAHDASPLLDVSAASKRKRRPWSTAGGSDVWTGRCATSVAVDSRTTETALSNRVNT
jgi:hypothetical protein